MQMFDGCTMGVFNHYGINFDLDADNRGSGNGLDQGDNGLAQDFDDIKKAIDELTTALTDDDEDNDKGAKEKGYKTINEKFNDSFKNYLKEHSDKRASLANAIGDSIQRLVDKFEKDNGGKIPPEFAPLTNFAEEIGIKLQAVDAGDGENDAINVPVLEFKGEFMGIQQGGDNSEKKLSSGLVREKPGEGQEEPDEELQLYKTIENVESQLGTINRLLENEKLKNNALLTNLRNGLKNLQAVINNTTPENVKKLQRFVSKNLEGDEQKAFDEASKRGDDFDGKFGKGTLKGVNIVLEKTDAFIRQLEQTISESEHQSEVNVFDNVKINNEIDLPQGDVEAESLLQGPLPDGVKAEFKEGTGVDKAKTEEQEVTIVLKKGDKTEEKSLIVKVEDGKLKIREKDIADGGREAPSTQSVDTTPLTIDGKQHQVVERKSPLDNPALSGITLYSKDASDNPLVLESGRYNVLPVTLEQDRDTEFLAKLDNSENVYRVKIDSKGNLCPTAVNAISNVAVVMENSPSGIAYIENKLPDAIKGKVQIGWNGEDYTISLPGGGKKLTIEPMTIDGKWIGSLTDSLAFLNLTNYLRNSGKMHDIEFKNDNPDLKLEGNDLYVRVKKTRDVDGKKVKWLRIKKDTFGLPDNEVLLSKYIKYNNHEHWEDDWDNKKRK